MADKEKETTTMDNFLESTVAKKVQIFLTSGIKLEGTVRSYDDHCIILENNLTSSKKETVVMRHSIASIVP